MKTTLLIAALTLFSLVSCKNDEQSSESDNKMSSSAAAGESKPERNKKVAMSCFEGINAHDMDKIFKDVAPSFMDHMDGTMPPQNADSARKMFGMLMNAFPDMKAENPIYYTDGDKVLVEADWSGTFKNDMGPVKATGKSVAYKDVDIFTFDADGKIVAHRNIYPGSMMMMNAGADMKQMQMMMKTQ